MWIGEIASRVMRTARDMGIQTVAVHSDPDADALFVDDALFSVSLGGRTSAQSYLDAEKVLDAARRSGADAIHLLAQLFLPLGVLAQQIHHGCEG